MAKKPLPSQEVLRQLLSYDPETGKLFWKSRGIEWFKDGAQTAEHNRNLWNGKNAGKEAFTADTRGYRTGRIFDSQYFSHRVIWKLLHGTEPDEVDHINGDRSDNRAHNLRDVSCATNGRNKAIQLNNTTGYLGVYRARRGKWRAAIQHDGRQVNLGHYDTIEGAIAARDRANKYYGYHDNHGRA